MHRQARHLEALVDAFAPGEPVHHCGHSLGGNVVLHYAGVRPARARSVISLDGFGIRAEEASLAPAKYAKWLDALATPPAFAPYRSLDAVADRLQKNNRRLPRDKALFLARHWARAQPDGSYCLASDPRHKLPFPTVYRIEETYAVWRNITAPALWVAAEDSHIPQWLDEHPEGEGATDNLASVRRRFARLGSRPGSIAAPACREREGSDMAGGCVDIVVSFPPNQGPVFGALGSRAEVFVPCAVASVM